jgi:hypothetical protein
METNQTSDKSEKKAFEQVLEQFENVKSLAGKFATSEERLKKYFNTILPKGVKTADKRIRILDSKTSPFKEVYFHEIKVGDKWLKLWDPKNEGLPSPLNKRKEELEAQGLLEESKAYRSKKFYIVKLIDRENEQDGPKFWRFKSTKNGVFDKIVTIIRTRGNILDSVDGRDITISLGLTESNNKKWYTSVTNVIPEDKSPLTNDPKLLAEWVGDELEWTDVYAKRPFEYLQLVANGIEPVYDKDSKTWVSKSELVSKLGEKKAEEKAAVENIVDPQADEPADDQADLPF